MGESEGDREEGEKGKVLNTERRHIIGRREAERGDVSQVESRRERERGTSD